MSRPGTLSPHTKSPAFAGLFYWRRRACTSSKRAARDEEGRLGWPSGFRWAAVARPFELRLRSALDSRGATDDAALIDRGLLIMVQMKLDFGQYDEAARMLGDASPSSPNIASRDACDPYTRMAPETTRPVASPLDDLQKSRNGRRVGLPKVVEIVRSAMDPGRFSIRPGERKCGPARTPHESKFSMTGPRPASGPPMTHIASVNSSWSFGGCRIRKRPASNHAKGCSGV